MMTSRVPSAVDALLEILRAASGLSEVSIFDGPPSVNLSEYGSGICVKSWRSPRVTWGRVVV